MTDAPRTLYEKIWDAHVVETQPDGTSLIYIDRHLVHEVTSPQAFEALRVSGRAVRRPDLTLAVSLIISAISGLNSSNFSGRIGRVRVTVIMLASISRVVLCLIARP